MLVAFHSSSITSGRYPRLSAARSSGPPACLTLTLQHRPGQVITLCHPCRHPPVPAHPCRHPRPLPCNDNVIFVGRYQYHLPTSPLFSYHSLISTQLSVPAGYQRCLAAPAQYSAGRRSSYGGVWLWPAGTDSRAVCGTLRPPLSPQDPSPPPGMPRVHTVFIVRHSAGMSGSRRLAPEWEPEPEPEPEPELEPGRGRGGGTPLLPTPYPPAPPNLPGSFVSSPV